MAIIKPQIELTRYREARVHPEEVNKCNKIRKSKKVHFSVRVYDEELYIHIDHYWYKLSDFDNLHYDLSHIKNSIKTTNCKADDHRLKEERAEKARKEFIERHKSEIILSGSPDLMASK